MTAEILNKLQELAIGACDQLYAARQLITVSAVQKIVMTHGLWSTEVLERQLPGYINEWRMSNLKDCSSNLPTEASKYELEIARMQAHIDSLKSALVEKNLEINRLKENIIQNLRGLLSA